jgi:glycosyltransferase involved in cell wall biosynthesis
MRIGIDLLYLIPGVVGGGETYACCLLHGLAEIDPRNEYFIFVNRSAASWPIPNQENFHRVVCPISGVNRAARYAWEQFALPVQLRSQAIDLCHAMGNVSPLLAPCPTVVTIHDVNYVGLREFMPARRRRTLRFFSRQAARRAQRIITVSHFSQGEIVRYMHIDSERISVIHEGPGWVQNGRLGDLDALRLRYKLPEHYVVAFTGGGIPHKNVDRLISAFEIAREGLPHRLLLIGNVSPFLSRRIHASRAVQALGYVPNEDIHGLLRCSDLFVLASSYEGFGLPVVEAQRAGSPVACSQIGALLEVAADAAAYFDPHSIDDIVSVVRSILTAPGRRDELINSGRTNSYRFSWRRTAEETLRVYERVASSARGAAGRSSYSSEPPRKACAAGDPLP